MTPDFLPEPLPADPFGLFAEWFGTACAKKIQPNPDAMVLATVDARLHPAARVVLCKQLVATPGYVVFFTNYRSRKGEELAAVPRAAAVFHWDTLQRQVRLEGPVVRSPANESDAYFASRALSSRIGAWASEQSQPLASRATLAAQLDAAAVRFGITPATAEASVPRPAHWGGFRLWPDAVELWVEGPNRIHDRARWTRLLEQDGEFAFHAGQWTGTRLNP